MKTYIVPVSLSPRAGNARLAFSAVLLFVLSLAWSAQAQTPCQAGTCTRTPAHMVCPPPGDTLPGNDVTFSWCDASADYFLQIESIPGAHDIFYAIVPAQNFVHLLNLPTNGATIYVSLWTQIQGNWSSPSNYIYTAASPPPSLAGPMLGTNGQFQFTINGLKPGRTNVVQSSLDLSNWTSIRTNVAVSNSFRFIDAGTTNFTRLFYRIFEMR